MLKIYMYFTPNHLHNRVVKKLKYFLTFSSCFKFVNDFFILLLNSTIRKKLNDIEITL